MYLLQRYLTQKFKSEEKSSEWLSKLMNILTDVDKCSKLEIALTKLYADMFTPLVRQTFDLDDN